jgi:hypothetical protein
MKSPHSRVTKAGKQKAVFSKHNPFETAASRLEAKFLAQDQAENYRYAYRATANLQGNAAVKVGQVIYLDGLAQGMSGYWVVLSATHKFGSGNAKYELEVLLGADTLGDSVSNPTQDTGVRDFDAESVNQSLTPSDSYLTSYDVGINGGDVESAAPTQMSTNNTPLASTVTSTEDDIYASEVPDLSQIPRTTTWGAAS